jgi:hypothetical protein
MPVTGRSLMRRPHSDRYQLVFLLLIASFLLSALLGGSWVRLVTLIVYLIALLVALRSARLSRTRARNLRWPLLVGSLVVAVLAAASDSRTVEVLSAAWLAMVLLTTVVLVVARVLQHRVVTLQTIFGALSAYLLIGFFFAALYTALARLDVQSFFAGGQPATSDTIQYFSFVTLTTTGYGDFTAAGPTSRAFVVLEALVGQIFLVTLVARLVSVFGTARRLPGPVDGADSDPAGPMPGDASHLKAETQ